MGGALVPSPSAVASWLVSGLGGPGNKGFARVGDELASRSERPSCDTPGACSYWREALHGLVSGLSSSVRYSRVSSGSISSMRQDSPAIASSPFQIPCPQLGCE